MAECLAINPGKLPQFNDVDDALTGLALIEKRMRHAHSNGYIALGEPGLLPSSYQL